MQNHCHLSLRVADPAEAAEYHRVIQEAFGARPALDPPAEALSDQVADVAHMLTTGYGIGAYDDDRLVACLVVSVAGDVATLRRVSVAPDYARSGLSLTIVQAALELAADAGCRQVELIARQEFPQVISFWAKRGFYEAERRGHIVVMRREAPRLVEVPSAEAMHRLGTQLARVLQPGDVVVLSGDLGAGKTTLTQGIGAGLGVKDPVISPTFVISRIHRSGRVPLVHVDAYRLATADELADIDLDTMQPASVTVVEWGEGKAEWLSADRLEIRIVHEAGDTRSVIIDGLGERWRHALDTLELL